MWLCDTQEPWPGPNARAKVSAGINVVGLMAADSWFPAAKTEFNLKLPLGKTGRVTGVWVSHCSFYFCITLEGTGWWTTERSPRRLNHTQKTPRHSAIRFASLLLWTNTMLDNTANFRVINRNYSKIILRSQTTTIPHFLKKEKSHPIREQVSCVCFHDNEFMHSQILSG